MNKYKDMPVETHELKKSLAQFLKVSPDICNSTVIANDNDIVSFGMSFFSPLSINVCPS